MLIRQLGSIIALPGVVAVAVPVWIARRNHITFTWPDDVASAAVVVCGLALLAAGVGLFAGSLYYFWTRGRGTLAPWDPPRRFVVEGPYRFVRNPMISGVIFVLLAEACIFRARPLAEWAGLFVLINVIYIPLLEEPMLVARFGEPYVRYKEAVRRFLPRLHPWTPRESDE
jgi:protein-S-isoprenylcysteine O-methyltransferase Ste14